MDAFAKFSTHSSAYVRINIISGTPPNAGRTLLKQNEVDLAATLVAISVMFVVCQSIKVIPDIYEVVYCYHLEVRLHKRTHLLRDLLTQKCAQKKAYGF
jgi:hypothetical protein